MKLIVRIAAVAVVLLGACASDGPATDVFGDDASVDRLVLVVDIEGGLTQSDYLLAFPPTYSIYADGSMYFMTPPAPGAPNPLPLLKNIGIAQLTGTQRRTMAALVGEMELPDIDSEVDRSQAATIIDGLTTRATLIDPDGTVHSYGVYSSGGVPNQGTRSAALGDLLTELNNIAANADLVEHQPVRIEVTWRRQRGSVSAQVLPWPVSTEPADFGEKASAGVRCMVLEGDEALETAELMFTVAWESRFTANETVYRVIGRNLLPNEVGCA